MESGRGLQPAELRPFFKSGDANSLMPVFLSQLDVMSTFGLHPPKDIQRACKYIRHRFTGDHSNKRNWTSICQSNDELEAWDNEYSYAVHTLRESPFLLLTVTLDPHGTFILPPRINLQALFDHLPSETLLVIAAIPFDPLQSLASFSSHLIPVDSGPDCHRSSSAQCAMWRTPYLENKWMQQAAMPEHVRTRTFFICIPSLTISTHTLPGPTSSLEQFFVHMNVEARRHAFIWNVLVHALPQFHHCISWIMLDKTHLLLGQLGSNQNKQGLFNRSLEETRPELHLTEISPQCIHIDLPFSDQHFVNTLVFYFLCQFLSPFPTLDIF